MVNTPTGSLRRWLPAALAIGFTAVLLVPSLSAPAAASTGVHPAAATTEVCQGTALPVPADLANIQVTGGDPTGRYLLGLAVVSVPGQSAEQKAVWWVDGVLHEFPQAPAQPYISLNLTDANPFGVVVGFTFTDTPTFLDLPWVYRYGHFTRLPTLHPGDSARAQAVNARGDITGYDQDGSGGYWAVLWPADRPGTVRALGTGDPSVGTLGYDIDDNGTVVGWAGPYPGGGPYLWPAHGRGHLLPVPPEGFTEAIAIRNGWIVGYGASSVIWWNARTGAMLVRTPGVRVNAVNRSGTIAGSALVYLDGRRVAINGLARTISDLGVAAGTGANNTVLVWAHC